MKNKKFVKEWEPVSEKEYVEALKVAEEVYEWVTKLIKG